MKSKKLTKTQKELLGQIESKGMDLLVIETWQGYRKVVLCYNQDIVKVGIRVKTFDALDNGGYLKRSGNDNRGCFFTAMHQY